MASLTCPICRAPIQDIDLVCLSCGTNLTASHAPVPIQHAEPVTRNCPHCGEPLPDPDDVVCVHCLRDVRSTGLRVRVIIGSDVFHVEPGATLLLGRDPVLSPAARALTRHDNVSRRHATVGLDMDGAAWVRDEHSTNGTYLNGEQIAAGAPTPLRVGDRLRLAATVTLDVALSEAGEGSP